MNVNIFFGGCLISIFGIVFMVLYRFLAESVNLQFFVHKNPFMTPVSSYGQKTGRSYVLLLGSVIFILGLLIMSFGFFS